MDKNTYQQNLKIKNTIKRYALTLLCSIPILAVLGVVLQGKVNSFVRVIIFALVLGVIVFFEEFVYLKIANKKDKNKIEKEDVFK